jgi:hypothetical protein
MFLSCRLGYAVTLHSRLTLLPSLTTCSGLRSTCTPTLNSRSWETLIEHLIKGSCITKVSPKVTERHVLKNKCGFMERVFMDDFERLHSFVSVICPPQGALNGAVIHSTRNHPECSKHIRPIRLHTELHFYLITICCVLS